MNKIITGIICLILGFLLALYLQKCSLKSIGNIPPYTTITDTFIKKVDSIEYIYKERIKTIVVRTQESKLVTDSLKRDLNYWRKTSHEFEKSLSELVDELDDSSEFQAYIASQDIKDSISINLVASLDDQLLQKDSVIRIMDTMYTTLRVNYDSAITDNKTLVKANKKLKKKNIFLKIAIAALGIFTIIKK